MADVEDTGRIAQKLVLGRGDSGDLLAVNKTIQAWNTIMNRISEEKQMEALERSIFKPDDWESLDALMSRMTELNELSNRIGMALQDGCVIKGDSQANDEVEGGVAEENDESMSDNEATNIWRQVSGKWIIKPQ